MGYLASHPEAQFSPSGVLKTALPTGEARPAADSIFETLFGVLESWLQSDETTRSA